MKVAIRADASRVIGTGHIRRCLALAHALRDLGVEVRFVTRQLGLPFDAEIGSVGFAVSELPAPTKPIAPDPHLAHAHWAGVEALRDASETAAVLDQWAPDWLVVDSYAFDARWHAAVRDRLACRVAAIDDLADRDLAADIVIDHNFVVDPRAKYAGLLAAGTQLLCGPRFALLGPAYDAAKPRTAQAEATSVGIFMGGVDQLGLSAFLLGRMREAGFAGPVEIVAGSRDPRLLDLQSAVAADAKASLHLDLPDLAAFFARHELQIGAGGGATWERCCLGAPSLLVMTAENQRAVVPALAAAGIVAACEPTAESFVDEFKALLSDPARRKRMGELARALVDGQGARRVALAMTGSSLTVRPATLEDGAIMFAWRNAPATRSVSRNSEPIDRNAHDDWMARSLADPNRLVLIGMIGSKAVGVVRFDRRDAGAAEVSLYLDPDLHGLGLGTHLLAAGERALPRGLCILAEVLEGNGISARLFEKSGYQRIARGHFRKNGNSQVEHETNL